MFTYKHDYFLIKILSDTTRKIGCHYCKRVFAMNDDARCVLPWDSDFEMFYIKIDELNKSLGIVE
jgi:hypothetical protein